ncbi:basal body-orientation factor 1-like [Sphaeramia orbicularis]|uniref:basal body-orientation factor 1-like n=1 Tax=Sphaeramia orbicularis TaxID=375764 RepID=UPI0011811F27|nr:basal body-orientation factor 1 [Sphaeramia orbicularis]
MPKKKASKVKRAKAGKGKKDGKQESKADKETDFEKAKANAALWELRLKVTDQSLVQHRDSCRKLARANEELTNQLFRMEKETIDMTGFFKRQHDAKEEKINMLVESLKNQEILAGEQQNKLVEDYTFQINEMKDLFKRRSNDFNMIEDGMRKIKEFQKRKAEMEQELSDITESMEIANKEHRENLNKMEYKFFKEKARLEREAEQTIALVVEKAHNEAVVQLDDASRSVFKENVRLNEALKHHTREADELQKLTDSLVKENATLTLDKNAYEVMAKKNTVQMKAQEEELSKLKTKVTSLEQALRQKAEESEREQEKQKKMMSVMTQASQVELVKMQKVLAMREKELGHIKRLAGTIVKQRTELEQFFHEALAQVKHEIMASRSQYKKEALQAYRWTLRGATEGKLKFPPIRTFHKGPHSTNSVYSDMEAAARWTHRPGSNIEISELTWEQKEQVLRLLFAKMNGQTQRKTSQHLVLSASTEKKNLTDKLERRRPKRPSSPRRLSPFCPRIQTAYRICIPHDLCVASSSHIARCIVCVCFISFPQTGEYNMFASACNKTLTTCVYIWLMSTALYILHFLEFFTTHLHIFVHRPQFKVTLTTKTNTQEK